MLRTTVILFVSVMLNGCQISPIKSNVSLREYSVHRYEEAALAKSQSLF
jgi:hypothetical protein